MQVFDQVSFDKWQEIADKCEYATFFHTLAWSKIFVETYPKMKIATKKFVFDDGSVAIFPLVKIKKRMGLFNSHVSNVAGTYGGWISEKNLSEKQINEMIKWINKNLKDLTWRVNPFDIKLRDISIPNMQKDFTQYLDLKQGFDSIYKLWTKRHSSVARKARKARKEGVLIKQADLWEDWRQYFEIYQDSIKRWGNSVSSKYPIELFKNLFQEQSKNIKLWLAYFEEKPIAGALCFYHNHHVVYWHGAALENYFFKKPSNLLQYEIIKDACENNYWWYDFNSSGGHEGVMKFKKSFGTEKISSNIITRQCKPYKIIKSVCNNFKRHKKV
ncbi:MAG: GNAT family N-acetyltransferase [Candidatus Andersenbacteria bacterium]|nr:GNAT family N-acetyltransferase [Candidatus Andersenbacteria bacterium]